MYDWYTVPISQHTRQTRKTHLPDGCRKGSKHKVYVSRLLSNSIRYRPLRQFLALTVSCSRDLYHSTNAHQRARLASTIGNESYKETYGRQDGRKCMSRYLIEYMGLLADRPQLCDANITMQTIKTQVPIDRIVHHSWTSSFDGKSIAR